MVLWFRRAREIRASSVTDGESDASAAFQADLRVDRQHVASNRSEAVPPQSARHCLVSSTSHLAPPPRPSVALESLDFDGGRFKKRVRSLSAAPDSVRRYGLQERPGEDWLFDRVAYGVARLAGAADQLAASIVTI
jgi:hypothetical protein